MVILEQIIKQRINTFKDALTSSQTVESMVEQYVLHGDCVAVSSEAHFALKERLASRFNLEVNRDVFVVGSAHMGFSIAPQKRYKAFGDTSDVDVAIINHELFSMLWHQVDEYRRSGAYWPGSSAFYEYLDLGWIRPDKLPDDGFAFKNDWFEFFRSLHSEKVCGPLRIAAGIYHDSTFLRKYQSEAIAKCRQALDLL